MRSAHQQRVDEFMRLAKQEVPVTPVFPDVGIRLLRAKLILEEALETVAALGFVPVAIGEDGTAMNVVAWDLQIDTEGDVLSVIDGCCDLKVVTTGTLSAMGLPDEPFQEEVDRNNLAKFAEGHSWREDGKLIKPPGHKPPDLKAVMRAVLSHLVGST